SSSLSVTLIRKVYPFLDEYRQTQGGHDEYQWDEREGSAQSVLKSSLLLAPRYPKRSSLEN
ncbi:MAG: hypothetical protein ABL921_29610, partial [Pirellula sp.]